MNSAVYEGVVRHRRYAPVEHAFDYRLFMMYLDLAELDEVFRGRLLWSTRRFAPAWFRRVDHLGGPSTSLDEAVRELVEEQTGVRARGPIRLLTHLRYFGCCFNPVSFYYLFDEADTRVETIVAEVDNTPWGERHPYVLGSSLDEGAGRRHRYRFAKAFHVSPFMPMEQGYDWRLTDPGDRLLVHMENHDEGGRCFDATMTMRRREISGPALGRVLVRYPLMTARVVTAIYWQAFRLWAKGCPFHSHPKHRVAVETNAS